MRKIWIAKEADQRIRCLDREERARLTERLAQLRRNPRQAAKRLQGWDGIRSSRVGAWRLFFVVADDVKVLGVERSER